MGAAASHSWVATVSSPEHFLPSRPILSLNSNRLSAVWCGWVGLVGDGRNRWRDTSLSMTLQLDRSRDRVAQDSRLGSRSVGVLLADQAQRFTLPSRPCSVGRRFPGASHIMRDGRKGDLNVRK